MRTIRRLIFREVLRATGFVALAFILLFIFFDFIDQLEALRLYAALGYTLPYALLYVALQVPGRLYELLPIAVLIGTIYVMARMAENSEFTILRTSGLEPTRALRTLLLLGLGFAALAFVLGDYVAPAASRLGQTLQARFQGNITVGRTGAWMKDNQGDETFSVNVGALTADGTMNNVRIFAFASADGRPLFTAHAASGRFEPGAWALTDVTLRTLAEADGARPHIGVEHLTEWSWPTTISADMVAAALLDPDRMRTTDLLRYINHLQANGQSAQRYQIQFWRNVFYPLSCLVMMVLALPFGYLHFRTRNLTAYVFAGVLFGISFFLLNNVFGFIGNLHNWTPWIAAAAPGLLYSTLALGAFGWLVLRR